MTQIQFYEMTESYRTQSASKLPAYFQKAISDFNLLNKNYANVLTFLQLPLLALFSWLSFKKKAQNFAEHFTIMAFALSLSNTFAVLTLLVFLFVKGTLIATLRITMFLIFFSLALTYRQFYGLSWFAAIGRGISVYLTSYIIQMLILSVLMIAYIFWLKSKQ